MGEIEKVNMCIYEGYDNYYLEEEGPIINLVVYRVWAGDR